MIAAITAETPGGAQKIEAPWDPSAPTFIHFGVEYGWMWYGEGCRRVYERIVGTDEIRQVDTSAFAACSPALKEKILSSGLIR